MSQQDPTQQEMLIHILGELRDITDGISKQALDISMATGYLKKLFDELIQHAQQDEEAIP